MLFYSFLFESIVNVCNVNYFLASWQCNASQKQ